MEKDRIATVAELRKALEDLADDMIVVEDGWIYIGPGSVAYEDEEE